MSDKIRVNTNSLKGDSDNISLNIKNIKSSMNNLKNNLAKLDSMWDGPSSESFKNAFNRDVEALNTVIENLASVNSFEINSKSKYEACEQQVGSIVSGIKV